MNRSREEIKSGLNEIKTDTLAISEEYFEEKLSVSLISYYNMVIAITENTDITNKKKKSLLKELYNKYQPDTIEILLEMLEQIYSNTSTKIKDIYEVEDLPTSKITFYDKDGLTIEDRLDKYFNPKNKDTFIKRKEQALNKMRQITKSESLNEMNIVEYDKLFDLCSSYEIYNDDYDDDCETEICPIHWGLYSSLEEPPEMPMYHPVCECHVAYYIE